MTQDDALHLFEYRDGQLYWRVQSNSKVPKGALAGSLNKVLNRVYVRVARKPYLRSRLIFLMHKGFFPVEVDHIDGNRLNDTIENLREATSSENQHNKRLQRNNTSGYKNVRQKNKKWTVQLKVKGKDKYIGYYDDIELAGLVAVEARNIYHGVFANHGA